MRLYYSVHDLNSTDLTFVRLQHGMWTYVSPSYITFFHGPSITLTNEHASLRIAEITTAIVCASLPLVPKFLSAFKRRRSVSEYPAYQSQSSNSVESSGKGIRKTVTMVTVEQC